VETSTGEWRRRQPASNWCRVLDFEELSLPIPGTPRWRLFDWAGGTHPYGWCRTRLGEGKTSSVEISFYILARVLGSSVEHSCAFKHLGICFYWIR
jgi:hypothetical protein